MGIFARQSWVVQMNQYVPALRCVTIILCSDWHTTSQICKTKNCNKPQETWIVYVLNWRTAFIEWEIFDSQKVIWIDFNHAAVLHFMDSLYSVNSDGKMYDI